ncbi:uncharacterized protein LOC107782227 [Nicotiana tabacum]|uniref:Uncharacterized protein LOC107782227 n=1 Tax=Nicotiana tabacum TaxID=4097 RepID=A0A1S3Z336_TOBAC|nr:PREDICTED: uncharacterized protein LOC107782227 [Nicotiana tabacum]
MDDDSFRARVHKVFGALSSSAPSSAWSLTDDEVEKKEWNRSALKQGKEDDDQTLCSSSYDGLFKQNGRRNLTTQGLQNDPNDEESRFEDPNDVWEIRSSIGLDPTLDNEDEEDEYDRVAEGRVGAADRLYMNAIDQETSYDPSGRNICRDARANHMAAQVRLKEDADAAVKCETHFDGITLCGEQQSTEPLQVHSKVKPILKRTRKSENGVLKSMKRVRFNPSCKDKCEGASELEVSWAAPAAANSSSQKNESILDNSRPNVPDHILNPSKYTHYSLDSPSKLDDESNIQACVYLLEEVKKLKHDQLAREIRDVSATNTKSVAFVPRQKNSYAIAAKDATPSKEMIKEACNVSLHPKGFPVAIAAVEAQESGDPMEEDMEAHVGDNNIVSHKPVRHYRSKAEMNDSVT